MSNDMGSHRKHPSMAAKRILNVSVALLFGTLGILLIWSITTTLDNTQAIRESQRVGREKQNATLQNQKLQLQNQKTQKQILRLIKSCVEPNGDCSKRGAKNTDKAVSNIGKIIVLSAACSADLPPGTSVDERVTKTTACVTQGLARGN